MTHHCHKSTKIFNKNNNDLKNNKKTNYYQVMIYQFQKLMKFKS